MVERQDPDNYDLFISYARADNCGEHAGWVERLVQAIQDEHHRFSPRSLRVFLDLQAVRTMDDWEFRVLEGLHGSRLMLVILSPAYFRSRFCRREWQIYRDQELERALLGTSIAPVYVVKTPDFDDKAQAELDEWRKDLRGRQYVDMCDLWMEGIEALRHEDVRRRLEQLNQQLSDRLDRAERCRKSPTTVPPHNRKFVGRVEELRRLHECLIPGRVSAISAVHGLGGVGKSALAFEYAHAFAHEYPGGRFLLHAAGADDLRLLLATLAPELGLTLTAEERRDPDAALAQLRQALGRRGTTLLVLDNVDNPSLLRPDRLAHYLPVRDQIHVLVTTRLGPNRLPGLDCLALDTLPEASGLRLLEQYRPFADEEERVAAAQVVRRLCGHALALEVVAVYLWRTNRVSYGDYLARLQREGIGAVEGVGREDEVQLSLHPEKLLGPLLEPTLAGLESAELRAVEHAALFPSDRVALPWMRALVGDEFPDVARKPARGYPDSWERLKLRLFGLRLLTSGDEPQLARMHRIIQEVVRARLGPARCAERKQLQLKHIEERGQILRRSELGADGRWEVDVVRAYVEALIERRDACWDDLVRCARVYCGMAERFRDEDTALEEWARRGEIERLQTALKERQNLVHPGLDLLWAATLLAKNDRYESVAAAWWKKALGPVGEFLNAVDRGLTSHGWTTALLARALRDKGGPSVGAEPLPREMLLVSPPAKGALRTTLPLLYRFLAGARNFSFGFSRYGIGLIFFLMALAVIWNSLDFFLGDRVPWFSQSWSWVAYPVGALVLLSLVTLLLVGLPADFLLKRLAGRVGPVLAGVARWMEASESSEAKRRAFRQVIAFRSRVQSDDEVMKAACRAWTGDLATILKQGLPTVADKPSEVVGVIAVVSELEGPLIDALTDALNGLDALAIQDVFQKMANAAIRSKEVRSHLRFFVGVAHRLPDPAVVIDFFPASRTRLPADPQVIQSWLDLLHQLPASILGNALRASLRKEMVRRGIRFWSDWTERGWLSLGAMLAGEEFGPEAALAKGLAGEGMLRKLLGLPLRLSMMVFRILFYAMGAVLMAFWRFVLLAGRFHDPDGRHMTPLEAQRVVQGRLAARLCRGEGQPANTGVSRRLLGRVLRRLYRRGLLRGRARLVLYYMSDGGLLNVITCERPAPGEDVWHPPGPPTTDEAEQDREQERRALPLRPVWASWGLVTTFALLGSLTWLGGVAWFLPEATRWLFPFGLAETLVIAACCGLFQHYPHIASYRGLLGVLMLAGIFGIHASTAGRAEAAEVGVPGRDYGWLALGVLIPLVPLLIANLIVPEGIAWCRGSPLLYPTRWQLWFSRLLTVPAGAAACLLLAAVVAVLALGSPSLAPESPPWPDESDRGATHVVTATVGMLHIEDFSIPAPVGGRRGRSRRFNIELANVVVEKGEGPRPVRAYTSRVIDWPLTPTGSPEKGAVGQWYIPSSGQRVRLYLKRRWVDRANDWATYDVALPNGIDVLVEDRVIRIHSNQPLADDLRTFPEHPLSTWDELKAAGAAVLICGLFIAVLSVLVVVGRRSCSATVRFLQRYR